LANNLSISIFYAKQIHIRFHNYLCLMQFKDVIGQAHLKIKLLNNLKSGKISHAQLFLGETGSGSLALALAYAQYVNCTNPGDEDSCGECDNCRRMTTLQHPDLHFSFPVISKKSGSKPVSADYIDEWRKTVLDNPYLDYAQWMQIIEAENKQGNITAEECREIIKKLSLKPMYDGYKVLIIWRPEYMGKEGNILLKTLEEPAERTLIILIAENEESILQTILSRTQMQRVGHVSMNDLQQALMQKLTIKADEAGRIAHLADGNYNTALRLFEAEENNYTEEFIQWMRACFKPDMGAIIKWVDAMATTGRENQKNFLLYSIGLLRECILSNQGISILNNLLESEKDFVSKFSGFIGLDNIAGLNEAFSTAHYHVERNANPKILFFNLSLTVNELLQRYKKRA
jgi:DNA polymerase III subunit delta'